MLQSEDVRRSTEAMVRRRKGVVEFGDLLGEEAGEEEKEVKARL